MIKKLLLILVLMYSANSFGMNFLEVACGSEPEKLLQWLKKQDQNVKKSLWFDSIIKRKRNITKFFLEHKIIDSNEKKDEAGLTALMIVSAVQNDKHLTSLLLKKGADPKVTNKCGSTAADLVRKNIENIKEYVPNANSNFRSDDLLKDAYEMIELLEGKTKIS